MNNARRKQIADAIVSLRAAFDILETCADDERQAYDAMPESLQGSERGEKASEAADALEEQRDAIGDAITALEGIE